MAERHQLKVADPVVEADDPFAELTRIIGFDHRRPDVAPVAHRRQPVEAVEDDFGIDLEQELLGQLEAEDAAAESPVAVAADLDARFDAALIVSEYARQPERQLGWASWNPTPSQEAAAIGDAASDAGIAEDASDEESAADVLAGGGLAAADLDVDELAREFAPALEASGDDATVGSQWLAAEPAGSPSSELTDEPEARRELDTHELEEGLLELDTPELEEELLELDTREPEEESRGLDAGEPEDELRGLNTHEPDEQLLELDAHELEEELLELETPEPEGLDAGEPKDELRGLNTHESDEQLLEFDAHELEEGLLELHAPEAEEEPRRLDAAEPEDELRELDLAAEELLGDLTLTESAGGLDLDGAGPEEAVGEAAGPATIPGWAGRWDQSHYPNDVEDDLEAHFAGINLAADGTFEEFSEPEETPAAGGEDNAPPLAARAAVLPVPGNAPYVAAVMAAASRTMARSAELKQWVGDRGSTGDEADYHSRTVPPAFHGKAAIAAGSDLVRRAGHAGEPGAAFASVPGVSEAGLPAAAVSPAAAAEPQAAEFSLEDELNALLGNIRAAGRRSAATTQALRTGSASASAGGGTAPGVPMAFDPRDFAPQSDVRAGNRAWARPSSAPREDVPGFDDVAFGAALAEGLDNAGFVTGEVAGKVPFDAVAAVAAGAADPKPYEPSSRPDPGAPGGAVLDGAPEIETVEVAERPVALADDLDIPELDFQDPVPVAAALDDLDAEFASLLNEMNLAEPAEEPAGDPAGPAHAAHDADVAAQSEAPPPAAHDGDWFELDADYLASREPQQYEPGEAFHAAGAMIPPAPAEPWRRRRGLLFAGLVGAVALAGGVGALGLSFGGLGGDAPVLVEADPSPVKVRPENPGGISVPNQDSAVYESVAGKTSTAEPKQEKLVTTAEEPIDVSPPIREEIEQFPGVAADEEVTAAPRPKSEDRIAQIVQEAEEAEQSAAVAAVAPRKVRTMIVRPDGTLVAREEPVLVEDLAAAAADATVAAAKMEGTAAVAGTEATASVPEAGSEPAAQLPAAGQEQPAGSLVMPDVAPIAPQRPAEQPAAREVRPGQVAAATPTAPSAAATPTAPSAAAAPAAAAPAPAIPAAAAPAIPAAGGAAWSMQIASQPNEAAARSTYQDLAGRYAGVLAGRQVDIVKAEIAGKGTFWRVRVPADSRNDAIRLCESYKEAGGNCFVSR